MIIKYNKWNLVPSVLVNSLTLNIKCKNSNNIIQFFPEVICTYIPASNFNIQFKGSLLDVMSVDLPQETRLTVAYLMLNLKLTGKNLL